MTVRRRRATLTDRYLGSNYLTRRIRTHVYGDHLDFLMEKQITIPIRIPHDLEQTVNQYISAALSDAGVLNDGSYRVLIPVHVAGQGTSIIPDLQDIDGPPGNLRYWVLSNETMWTGIDPRIDAVFEILLALFRSNFVTDTFPMTPRTPDNDFALSTLARLLRDLRSRLPRLPPDWMDDKIIENGQRSW